MTEEIEAARASLVMGDEHGRQATAHMAAVVILLDQFYRPQPNQSIWTALWDVVFATSFSISESYRCAALEVVLAATSILQDELQFPRILPVLFVSSICII